MAELGSTNVYGDIKITGEARKQGVSLLTKNDIGSMAERNLFVSENEPDDSQGEDGDIWFQYE